MTDMNSLKRYVYIFNPSFLSSVIYHLTQIPPLCILILLNCSIWGNFVLQRDLFFASKIISFSNFLLLTVVPSAFGYLEITWRYVGSSSTITDQTFQCKPGCTVSQLDFSWWFWQLWAHFDYLCLQLQLESPVYPKHFIISHPIACFLTLFYEFFHVSIG